MDACIIKVNLRSNDLRTTCVQPTEATVENLTSNNPRLVPRSPSLHSKQHGTNLSLSLSTHAYMNEYICL
jgi:hypothetical protein